MDVFAVSCFLIRCFFHCKRVHIWQNVLPAADGHAAVPVLPQAEAGVRGEGRRHQGRDGDWEAGHRVEDQSRGEREATDQSAAKNGTGMPRLRFPK